MEYCKELYRESSIFYGLVIFQGHFSLLFYQPYICRIGIGRPHLYCFKKIDFHSFADLERLDEKYVIGVVPAKFHKHYYNPN